MTIIAGLIVLYMAYSLGKHVAATNVLLKIDILQRLYDHVEPGIGERVNRYVSNRYGGWENVQ